VSKKKVATVNPEVEVGTVPVKYVGNNKLCMHEEIATAESGKIKARLIMPIGGAGLVVQVSHQDRPNTWESYRVSGQQIVEVALEAYKKSWNEAADAD